jgi:hypothetical protein
MLQKLAIRIEVFGSIVYTSDWLSSNMAEDPTSAVQSVTISKSLNSSNFSAVLSLNPQRDAQGEGWADKISLLDVIAITTRVGTIESVVETVEFFGFVEDITSSQSASGQQVKELVTIHCAALPQLVCPLLAFDRIVNPVASALGMRQDAFQTIITPVQGDPGLILNEVFDLLLRFLAPIAIHSKEGKTLDKYIGLYSQSIGTIMPFAYTTAGADEGFANSFWSIFQTISEVQGQQGWVHELYIDIFSAEKLGDLSSVDSPTYSASHLILPEPLPIGAKDPHYLMIVMRPNPHPFIQATQPASVSGNTVKLSEVDTTYDNSAWESMFNSRHMSTIYKGNPIQYQDNRNSANIITAFSASMQNDETRSWNWGAPLVVDIEAYTKRGYAPLCIATRFIHAKTSTSDPAVQEYTISVANLMNLNLMCACFNGISEFYKQATIVIEYTPDISIGEIFILDHYKNQERLVFYVYAVSNMINAAGLSTTQLTLVKGLYESDRDTLYDRMKGRFMLSQTMNMEERLAQLPLEARTNYLSAWRIQ